MAALILAWLSGAFLCGLIIGGRIPLPAGAALAAILVLMTAGFLLRRRRGWAVPWLLAALVLGVTRAPHAHAPVPGDLAYYAGQSVIITGVVNQEPNVRARTVEYNVAVQQLSVHGHPHPAHGELQIVTTVAVAADPGDSVQVTGVLGGPPLGHRADASMRYPRLIDNGAVGLGLAGIPLKLRTGIERGIDAWLPEPEAALLIAITVGARTASLGDLAPALTATGLIHLVAISGIKVALVAGTVSGVVRPLGRRWVTLAVSLGITWFYVLLTAATASGVRSAIMWSMLFLAVALGRNTLSLVSLGCTAAIMAGLQPLLLGDAGFLMSTAGTFAIVAFAGPLQHLFRFVPSPWRESLSVTLAAQVGIIPISLGAFHVVAWSGPVANMVVLPFLPLLIILGFLLGTLASLSFLAAPLAALAFVLLHLTVAIARSLAQWGGGWRSSGFSTALSVLYYGLITAVSIVIFRRVHWAPAGSWGHRGREILLALVAGAVALTLSLRQAGAAPGVQIDWIAGGHALLIQSPRATVLIDGSADSFALREQLSALLPFNHRTLDAVVVTDPRSANVRALDALLGYYSVRSVLDIGAEYPSGTYAQWRADLRRRHIPRYALRTGAGLKVGSIRVDALGPDGLYGDPRACIGLVRITIPGRSILWLGAANAREQREAVFRSVSLHAQMIVAPVEPLAILIRASGAGAVKVAAHEAEFSPSASLATGLVVLNR